MVVMMVMITQMRLNGIHEVVVLDGEFKDCTAALIVPTSRRRLVIYNGLILKATILRHDGPHMDLVVYQQEENHNF
ncbi:hypothetical protein [Alphabaculovirus altersperidaniae]|uniref:Uncharacterized protein n=1 Tax=Spodoptera eridania nucleopolyhedrovirus TaxID=2315721 RepID=A0ABX6TQG4_9ABAC|nr:hypothetical protein QKS47_gp133 [Spodoptera eridania nucleopolyhedrovirus]QNV47905.1 hypothetical protein [Spodoptera eridania nucleopolyhedrovirus]